MVDENIPKFRSHRAGQIYMDFRTYEKSDVAKKHNVGFIKSLFPYKQEKKIENIKLTLRNFPHVPPKLENKGATKKDKTENPAIVPNGEQACSPKNATVKTRRT